MAFYISNGVATAMGFGTGGLQDSISTSLVGMGWTLIDNQSTSITNTFVPADVNTGTGVITISGGHGFFNGQHIYFKNSGGSLPSGLSASLEYFVIYDTPTTFKVATTLLRALAGTSETLSSQGTGTHSVYNFPFKVFCTAAAPTPNQVCKYIVLSYIRTYAASDVWVPIQCCLYWNTTTHIGYGYWFGTILCLNTATGNNYYSIRGNTDVAVICARTSTGASWTQFLFDNFIGASNPLILEDPTKSGTLTSPATAGSFATLQLGSGQASNFTTGNSYYIYDFTNHSWVDYVTVTGRNIGLDQITVDAISYNYPTGAIIGPYPHRFYVSGATGYAQTLTGYVDNISSSYHSQSGIGRRSTIPYVSAAPGYVFHNQTGSIYGACNIDAQATVSYGALFRVDPDDNGRYLVQRPTIYEAYRNNSDSAVGCDRFYGIASNIYIGTNTNFSTAPRTIEGLDYTWFKSAVNSFCNCGYTGTFVVIVQNTAQ